ncbi:MAG: hypothetical protein LBI29_02620 [Rickettsiales bacterium]|jgi:hypothetical protein|nr:hypothetical protein [Rickettsiales bacterium]
MAARETKKTLLCFPNSFGFGPTGMLLSVLDRIKSMWEGTIVVASKSWSQDIVGDKSRYVLTYVDERSSRDILEFINRYENSYVISSLNRFAVEACKWGSIPCVFLDSLSWFWDNIPEYYFDADRYYAEDFLSTSINVKKLDGEKRKKVCLLPLIVDDKLRRFEIAGISSFDYTLYISALRSPFFPNLVPEAYLNLISLALNSLDLKKQNVLLTSCQVNLGFLSEKITNGRVRLATLPMNDYMSAVKNSRLSITMGGYNAAKNALANGTPLSFILPMNKTQWALARECKKFDYLQQVLEWANYIDNFDIAFVKAAQEKDVIAYFVELSERVYGDRHNREKFIADFSKMFDQDSEIKTKAIDLKIDNGDFMVNDLLKFWDMR